jgi:hypothetical protein
MKGLVKIGLIGVGGYLAYSWYKKRQDAKKDSREIGVPIDVELPTNEMGMEIIKGDIMEEPSMKKSEKPLRLQTAAEINGDNLTIEQKEAYIEQMGKVPLFEAGEGTFFSADGDTDDVGLEAALAEEDGEQGFGAYILSMRANNAYEDFKCGIKRLRRRFPQHLYLIDDVRKKYIEALYVLIKCKRAQERGEKGCQNIPAVQAAAKKRRAANATLKGINPRAVRMVMRICAKLGKKKRGVGAKVASTQSLKSRTKGRFGKAMTRSVRSSSMNGWD